MTDLNYFNDQWPQIFSEKQQIYKALFIMNKNKLNKMTSPFQRSVTPTLLIDYQNFSLTSYKIMLNHAKLKSKNSQSPGMSSTLSLNKVPSAFESIISTDTCVFPSPSKSEINEAEVLRNQLSQLQSFTKAALESQKKYFEEIINKLQREIVSDKDSFNKEVKALKQEIDFLKKSKKNEYLEGSQDQNIKSQFLKNLEFIKILEDQNKALYEKLRKK